jgi:type VI secretion system protein ImpF
MAELTTTDRLQPALLDRLIDDEPRNASESRERRVMSMRQLRVAVLRDIEWLLNAKSRPMGDEVWKYPRVARSVVNFGMPDLTGLTASGLSPRKLENGMLETLRAFEPRVQRAGMKVRMVGRAEDVEHNAVVFVIDGQLHPLPMPEALFLRTEVDLESGQALVKERAKGG